jgi:hypothetical protein
VSSVMDTVDDIELNIVSDTGDIELAEGIGKFLRDAIDNGVIEASQIASLVIIKTAEQ